MAILVSVALVEQYLGVSLIGSAPKDFSHVGDYRLSGPGGSLPTNRMAFYHILPITLLVSALLTRHVRRRFLTILALLVLSVGLVSTGSRGGTMGTLFALGLIWLLGRRRITSGFLIGFLILGGAVVVSTLVPEETFTRSEGIGLLANLSDRIHVWESSFEAFMRNPFLGVGWGQLESTVLRDTIYSVGEVAASAHNSLLEMLSEAGLLGTIPFVALCWHVLRVLWRGTYLEEEGRGTLNVGVFAAFSGMLLATMTSVYQFERYFWVPVAFAASLELRGAFQADQGAQGDQSLTKQHGSTPRQGAFQTGK
jgi:O-antigen ligase